MSVEQLLFLVLFVLLPLLNMLRKALRNRRPAPPVPEAGRVEPMPVRRLPRWCFIQCQSSCARPRARRLQSAGPSRPPSSGDELPLARVTSGGGS